MKREPSSWQLICTILRNHIKPGHTCEQTLNRLWTKNVVEHRPSITQSASTVYLEKWSLDRLWSLIDQRHITELGPFPADDPPIVVRWKGQDYRIDGRRRINQLKARNEDGPHDVVVLDIGDV